MKVAINCRSFLKKQPTGIGRYAYHLVKSLAAIDSQNEYQLYACTGLFSINKKLPRFNARNFITRNDWLGRGPASTVRNTDIYHSPSPGPWDMPEGARVIVTVHDVIFKAFPQGHTPQTIETGERQFADIRGKAAKIICCSQSTVSDLQKYFQVPREKVALVYQGIDKEIFYRIGKDEEAEANEALKKMGIKGSYLLSVGTIEPRKNLINAIKAFHRLKREGKFAGKFIVAGMKGWLHSNIGKLVEQLQLTREIKFLGYVSDRDLRYLYNMAEVFVFPSFYEGFGFPIIEAFCCEVPVVTSNVSSCPEIAGDAALTVDPDSDEAIAGAIEHILVNRQLRGELVQKGRIRAGDFDFRKTAQETLNIYNEVFRG